MRKLGTGVLLAVAVAFGPAVASAQQQWRLLYVRGAGAQDCPEEMALRMTVATRLGYDPFSSGVVGAVFARIGRQGDELVGSVELVDPQGVSRGTRDLSDRAASCDQMAQAMALTISLAIDPERAQQGDAETAAPPAEAPPPRAPRPPLTLAPAPRPAEPDRAPEPTRPAPSWALSAAGVSLLAASPAPAFGAAIAVDWHRGSLVLGSGALAALSPSATVERSVELDTRLIAGELHACWVRAPFEACGLALAGATWLRPSAAAGLRTVVGSFMAGGVRGGVSAPVTQHLELFAQVGVVGVLAPVRGVVDGAEAWQAPPYAALLALGGRVQFP